MQREHALPSHLGNEVLEALPHHLLVAIHAGAVDVAVAHCGRGGRAGRWLGGCRKQMVKGRLYLSALGAFAACRAHRL